MVNGDGIDEGVESQLGSLDGDRFAQHSCCPFETLTNMAADLGMIRELLHHACGLGRVGDSHETPEVPEILVANGSFAWLTQAFTHLGPLGQDERRNLGNVHISRQTRVG